MNSAFVLVLTVFLVSGEPVDIAVSVQDNAGSNDCSNRTENSRNCYPVDKVIHQIISKSRQVFKTVP